MHQTVLARRHPFASAHFYKQDRFTGEENRKVFGRCYTPYGHGHNYLLEAFLQGPIDPRTKMVVNLTDVDELLKDVCDPLDHQHLNFDVPYFKDKIPTTEVIAHYLREKLLEAMAVRFPTLTLNRIRLYETPDLWVEVRG